MRWILGVLPFENAQAAVLVISFLVFSAWTVWAFRTKGRETYDRIALLPLGGELKEDKGRG